MAPLAYGKRSQQPFCYEWPSWHSTAEFYSDPLFIIQLDKRRLITVSSHDHYTRCIMIEQHLLWSSIPPPTGGSGHLSPTSQSAGDAALCISGLLTRMRWEAAMKCCRSLQCEIGWWHTHRVCICYLHQSWCECYSWQSLNTEDEGQKVKWWILPIRNTESTTQSITDI